LCGLYGIINREVRPFRRDIFTTLGMANDRRGGDSCGVFIDGKVEYGIGKKALFEDFFWDSELLNSTTACQIALGHDRKASIGGITLEKAHPILIKNNQKEVEFAFIHNGTIYNYESLAKEYIPDIDCSKYSDSQILALIIYHKGFDVLSKYNGGAAFVAVDYRSGKPVTYLYKGASKTSKYYDTEEVERPLYISYDQNRLIFSSIASYLCALMYDDVYELKSNKVYKYVDGKLYGVKNIDRSLCQQQKEVVVTNYNYYGTGTDFIYIKYHETNNLYTDESNKLLHGKYRISNYGRIMNSGEKSNSAYVKIFNIYFFNGIPLRDKFTYNRFNKAFKKSGLPMEDFVKRHIVEIRFNSPCKEFFDGPMCYKAVTEIAFVPFNGIMYALGKCTTRTFKGGYMDHQNYVNDYNESFRQLGLWNVE
jgi:predicted glutamine amidotransferase